LMPCINATDAAEVLAWRVCSTARRLKSIV
jgi:hypothetical protein